MTNDEFRTAIETLWPGHGTLTRAAKHFDIDIRRIKGMLAPPEASSHRPVPAGVAREARELLAQFPNGVFMVDPRKSLAVLHQQMMDAGWRAGEAAAGILGAVLALARAHVPAEELRQMLEDRE